MSTARGESVPGIPYLLVDGFVASVRKRALEVLTYTETADYLNRMRQQGKTLEGLRREKLRNWPTAGKPPEGYALPRDLMSRALALDPKAIRECNRLLPGWPLHAPAIRAAVEAHMGRMVTGTDREKESAAEFLRVALFPRALDGGKPYRRSLPAPWAYTEYWDRVYPEVLYARAILKANRDGVLSQQWADIRAAVNRILAVLAKKWPHSLRFTTDGRILELLEDGKKTPTSIALTIMGWAIDRHPDTVKAEMRRWARELARVKAECLARCRAQGILDPDARAHVFNEFMWGKSKLR